MFSYGVILLEVTRAINFAASGDHSYIAASHEDDLAYSRPSRIKPPTCSSSSVPVLTIKLSCRSSDFNSSSMFTALYANALITKAVSVEEMSRINRDIAYDTPLTWWWFDKLFRAAHFKYSSFTESTVDSILIAVNQQNLVTQAPLKISHLPGSAIASISAKYWALSTCWDVKAAVGKTNQNGRNEATIKRRLLNIFYTTDLIPEWKRHSPDAPVLRCWQTMALTTEGIIDGAVCR